MAIEKEIKKKIDRKQQRLQEVRAQIDILTNEAVGLEAYIEGLQAALSLLPKADAPARTAELRAGSEMDKTRALIAKAGRPLYLREIMEGLGKPDTKKARMSLASSIGTYVRKGQIFTRTAPNTFGLVGMSESHDEDDVPDTFGIEEEVENSF